MCCDAVCENLYMYTLLLGPQAIDELSALSMRRGATTSSERNRCGPRAP
jgi:hypothetical protein